MSTDAEADHLIELLGRLAGAIKGYQTMEGEAKRMAYRIVRETHGKVEAILREARESKDTERLTHLGEVTSKSGSVHLLEALEKNPHTPQAELERLRKESGRSGA